MQIVYTDPLLLIISWAVRLPNPVTPFAINMVTAVGTFCLKVPFLQMRANVAQRML
jgi:hypothetical protein